MKTWKGIGLMSGTSLDGLDIAFCEFNEHDDQWEFQVLNVETIEYGAEEESKLSLDYNISAIRLKELDIWFGNWIGSKVDHFIKKYRLDPDFIASHGHTYFHQPEKQLNYQIGDGYEIYKACQVAVINDFRTWDIRLGGQGAPLVPLGDELLFSNYNCCLNLGGIANISGQKNGQRISFDVVPVNMVLNFLAQKANRRYDEGGEMARAGTLVPELINRWKEAPFLSRGLPKSLGFEEVDSTLLTKMPLGYEKLKDILHSYCHFAAEEIAKNLTHFDRKESVLVTGGGTFNDYFISLLRNYGKGICEFIIPDEQLIHYKEAIVFAFLGLLRLNNKTNCLKTVTGASYDSSAGIVINNSYSE